MAFAAAPAIAEAAEGATVASASAGEGAAASRAGGAAKGASKPSSADLLASGAQSPQPKQKKSSSKKSSGKSTGAKLAAKVGNRKSLLAELVVCVVILLLGTLLAPQGSKDGVTRMMVKGSALLGVFFVLAIVSTGGGSAQKAAGAIGLLVTMAYALTSSDVKNITGWITKFFKAAPDKVNSTDDTGEGAGGTIDTSTGEPPAGTPTTLPATMEV